MESWTYLNRGLLYPFGRISNLEVNKKLHQPVFFLYVSCYCYIFHWKYFCGGFLLLYKITKGGKKNFITPKSCSEYKLIYRSDWQFFVRLFSEYKVFVIFRIAPLLHVLFTLKFIYIYFLNRYSLYWTMCTATKSIEFQWCMNCFMCGYNFHVYLLFIIFVVGSFLYIILRCWSMVLEVVTKGQGR